jgi:UbiD family decarboxylase
MRALGDGEVVEIDRPVKPHEFEVTALLKQLEDRRQYPAVLFSDPTDMYGRPSPFPILTNLYATRERCAAMLDVDPRTPNWEVSLAFAKKSNEKRASVAVSSREAPVQQNVWRGKDADVGRLPMVRHFEMDFGPVITMTHVMRSLAGHYNVSFAKTFYKRDPHEMVVSLHTRDNTRIVREHEKAGKPTRIVNVLGHHPAFHLGSVAKNDWGADDYATLGAFIGEPMRLVPSATWGDEFMVPADAEMVIEAELPPGRYDLCDPFGEVARLYQAQCLRPVMEVKAIAFRDGAIMQDIFSGFRDSNPFGAVLKEGHLWNVLHRRFPNLHQIHCPDSSCGVYAVYVSLKDVQPGQAQEIGRLILETFIVAQCVVVVDADIDVFDEGDVLWAFHTYTNLEKGFQTNGNWERDRHVRHAGEGSGKAPQAGFATSNWGARAVIDATRPKDFSFGSRSALPADVMARVRLDDYLPGATARAATKLPVGAK